MMLHVCPAYGRDYKSKAEIVAHWNAGKDFRDSLTGQYVNREDAAHEGVRTINVRYKALRSVVVLNLDATGAATGGK